MWAIEYSSGCGFALDLIDYGLCCGGLFFVHGVGKVCHRGGFLIGLLVHGHTLGAGGFQASGGKGHQDEAGDQCGEGS